MYRLVARITLSLFLSSSAVLGAAALPTTAAPCWTPPVTAPVVEAFDAPACPWCAGHRGLEYAPTADLEVRAVAAGTVAFAGSVAGRRYVSVDQPDGLRATYGWLAALAVTEGDQVRGGEPIGTAGERFMFTLRRGDEYIDPAPLLGRLIRRPWLVPRDGPAREPPPARLDCPG